MALPLTGRTILVTGAARGVGRAIAQCLAEKGARLVLADILEAQGRETASALRGQGHDVRFLAADIGDPGSIDALARDIGAQEGALHGLVNNAAIATNVGGKMFDEIDIELWDRVQRVNVRGTWLVTRAVAALMTTGGRIVNIASDTALWGAPRLLAYTASKGAIMAMTRSLARELGPRGIGIACIAPGIMRNEATDYVPAERHKFYEDGRAVPGPQVPEDIVETVAFLLSEGALALTGQGFARQCRARVHVSALHRIDVDGISLLTRAGGDGVPLVLLHGIGSNAASFESLIAAMSDEAPVYAWDLPGYGASQALDEHWPLAANYAASLLHVLDALGVSRAIVLGHSLGCLIGGAFAAAHAERVAGVALIAPASGYGVPRGGVLPDHVQARIDDFDRLGAAAFARSRAFRLVFEPEHHADVVASVMRSMAALTAAPYAQAVRMLGSGTLAQDAARLAAPTLVAVGADDVVTPPAGVEKIAAALSPDHLVGGAMHRIARAGHAVTQEQPAALAALIAQLRADIEKRASRRV